MRILLALSALVVVAAVVALVVGTRDRGSGTVSRGVGSVSLVGDSLNVGIEPYVADRLPGWRISHDDVVGRSTDEGIAALEAAAGALAPAVVISLGTNDPQSDVAGFRDRVGRVLEIAGPRRCVVWATIWRGGPSDGLNRVLVDAARVNRNLVLVEWATMVDDDRALLAGDGVHGTPEGYARRARAVTDAVRSCRVETGLEAGS